MIRIFLSLHVVTIREPSLFQEAANGWSGKQAIDTKASPVPTFQMKILLSDPAKTAEKSIEPWI